MTEKQKRFCDEYLVDLNATQAAIRAGYSVKTAQEIGAENLTKPIIRNYINERMQSHTSYLVASQEEVLQYLTSVMRGASTSEEIAVVMCGDGISEVEHVAKRPSEKDRLKAAELLGKRYGLYTEKVDANVNERVIIVDDLTDGAD